MQEVTSQEEEEEITAVSKLSGGRRKGEGENERRLNFPSTLFDASAFASYGARERGKKRKCIGREV